MQCIGGTTEGEPARTRIERLPVAPAQLRVSVARSVARTVTRSAGSGRCAGTSARVGRGHGSRVCRGESAAALPGAGGGARRVLGRPLDSLAMARHGQGQPNYNICKQSNSKSLNRAEN